MKKKKSNNLSMFLVLTLLFAIASIPVAAQEGMAIKQPYVSQLRSTLPQQGGTIEQVRKVSALTCTPMYIKLLLLLRLQHLQMSLPHIYSSSTLKLFTLPE